MEPIRRHAHLKAVALKAPPAPIHHAVALKPAALARGRPKAPAKPAAKPAAVPVQRLNLADIRALSVAQLREELTNLGVHFEPRFPKNALVARLHAALNAAAPDPNFDLPEAAGDQTVDPREVPAVLSYAEGATDSAGPHQFLGPSPPVDFSASIHALNNAQQLAPQSDVPRQSAFTYRVPEEPAMRREALPDQLLQRFSLLDDMAYQAQPTTVHAVFVEKEKVYRSLPDSQADAARANDRYLVDLHGLATSLLNQSLRLQKILNLNLVHMDPIILQALNSMHEAALNIHVRLDVGLKEGTLPDSLVHHLRYIGRKGIQSMPEVKELLLEASKEAKRRKVVTSTPAASPPAFQTHVAASGATATRAPPSPCKFCGDPSHWNAQCPRRSQAPNSSPRGSSGGGGFKPASGNRAAAGGQTNNA